MSFLQTQSTDARIVCMARVYCHVTFVLHPKHDDLNGCTLYIDFDALTRNQAKAHVDVFFAIRTTDALTRTVTSLIVLCTLFSRVTK